MYWASTPHEVGALLQETHEIEKSRQRSATLRAGLVAATICNVHRKPGSPAISPEDFLEQEVEELTPEQALARMREWAASVNQGMPEA